MRLSTLICWRRTKISASRRALDWNSPMSAPQSNLSNWTIVQQHHPICTGSPAVWSFRHGQRVFDTDCIIVFGFCPTLNLSGTRLDHVHGTIRCATLLIRIRTETAPMPSRGPSQTARVQISRESPREFMASRMSPAGLQSGLPLKQHAMSSRHFPTDGRRLKPWRITGCPRFPTIPAGHPACR